MPLPREHLLDELATAYVQAVVAAAGATLAVSRRDYGVDGTIKDIGEVGEDGYFETGFPIEFQLKATTAALSSDTIKYDLRARNYNLIVSRPAIAIPYYLFLVCFDETAATLALVDDHRLVLNASAYWWTERGRRTENTATVRIQISLANRLTPDAIKTMLDRSEARFER